MSNVDNNYKNSIEANIAVHSAIADAYNQV